MAAPDPPFSTMYRNRGITTGVRASVYRGTAGLERGNTVDAEVTRWVREGVPPANDYSRRFIRHLGVMMLSDLATQVKVASTGHRWSTPVDMVALTGPRTPRVIECKTTSMSAIEFRNAYDTPDPQFPTLMSAHLVRQMPNTCRQRYTDQLLNGMNMYALTMKTPTGAACYGSLIVVCRDAVIEYSHDIRYTPGSGINTVIRSERAPKAKKIKPKIGKRAVPGSSTRGSTTRRRGPAAVPPRP